ncbi:hypothetical protein GY12_14570 [Micrococcus luteus]|nr:hypothetical protein GY12_14570 [Micrococcus luteus]
MTVIQPLAPKLERRGERDQGQGEQGQRPRQHGPGPPRAHAGALRVGDGEAKSEGWVPGAALLMEPA